MWGKYFKSFYFVCIAIVISACQDTGTDKKYTIGFSQCCTDPWREAMNMELKREIAFQTDIDLIIREAGNNSQTQIEDIRHLVREGVDVMIISPNESGPLSGMIDSLYNVGIPVILIDRKTNSTNYSSYIGADNKKIGKEAAKYAIDKINGKVLAIELQMGLTITPAINRHKGFKKELLSVAGNEIIGSLEDVNGLEESKLQFTELYLSNPDVNLIFSHTDRLAYFASKWLEEIDANHNVMIQGVDGLIGPDGGIQMILDGHIDVTFLYPTGGEQAIAVATDLLRGKQVERTIALATSAIDNENARMLKLQGDKLLNQQADIERQSEMLYLQSKSIKNQKLFSLLMGVFSLLLLTLIGIIFYQLRKNKKVNLQLAEKNQQISNQHSELEAMSKLTEEANKQKVEFFTNISHEFKTPLTLILAPTQDLIKNEKNISKESRSQLHLIKKNAERMHRLVGQLMDFRKIDTGKIKMRKEQVDLVEFIKDIMSVFVNLQEAKNIDFKFISQLKTVFVLADKEMLDKVFFNLISNAFKFTNHNGFIHVQLAESLVDEQVVVKISDNGRGMSKEHTKHVFERFYQGENYSAKGTGLGLSLSKKIIDLHDGNISVISEKGIGSTFTIRLPKQLLLEDTLAVDLHDTKEYESDLYLDLVEGDLLDKNIIVDSEMQMVGQTILIIEDNYDLVTFLTSKLSRNYRVLSASNGEDGIRIAETNIPDLIICDLMLPGIQGDEVVTFLKENVMTSHIPIIMLTARDSDIQKQVSFDQGVYDFITKPFNHELLISKINATFKNMSSFKKYYGKELIYDIAKKKINENEKQLLHKFDAFVQQNYNNPALNVDLLCKEMNMSKVQLYRKIKAITGSTINDFIQSVRIERAKDLLSATDLSLSEIAYKCGYSSSSYFSRNFKKAVGKSPSEWKKNTSSIL